MSQKILVAEDSATMRLVVEMAFKGSPYEIVSTDSGEQALKTAYAHRPSLIILDYHLPDSDSLQVCKAFKSDPNLREIPVLMLGGTFHPFNEDQAKLSGCNAVVMKPFKTDELTSRAQELIQAQPTPAMSQPMRAMPEPPGPGLATTVSPPPARLSGESRGVPRFGAPAPGNRYAHPNAARQPLRQPEPAMRQSSGSLRRPQPLASPALSQAPQPFSRPGAPAPPAAPPAPLSRPVAAQPAPPAPAAAPAIDPEMLNRLVREQVQNAVREQMLGMVRSVLNDLFKERILPRLLKYGEERIDDIVGKDIERLMHERIDEALARFVDNPPQ